MKSIFSFTDYQVYLAEFFKCKKAKNSFFSYRFMGQKTGMDPGLLNKIIHGKMHLSVNKIKDISSFCQLSPRQSEYFELMVKYGRATEPRDIRRYFEKLSSFKSSSFYKLNQNQYRYYKEWYNSAIWSILAIKDFSGDFKALSQMVYPPISAHQAKASVKLLRDLGLIAKNDSGIFKAVKKKITTGGKWKSSIIDSYQIKMLELAAQSLHNIPKANRDISSVTISVDRNDFNEICQRTREFRASLMDLKTGNTRTDCVYQINIQIFPLSKIESGGK